MIVDLITQVIRDKVRDRLRQVALPIGEETTKGTRHKNRSGDVEQIAQLSMLQTRFNNISDEPRNN